MPLFNRRSPRVVRRGSDGQAPPERTRRKVKGQEVEIARYGSAPSDAKTKTKPKQTSTKPKDQSKSGGSSTRQRTPRKPRNGRTGGNGQTNLKRGPRSVDAGAIEAPETGRKQMIVRRLPHQTQIVVLEGPVLVEHYVARSDRKSLVGNVYLGIVKNVLPGMEAAFVDFGEGKNGVLYAGDVQYDADEDRRGTPRIEKALKNGDKIMVQVLKDPMGHKGARLVNEVSLAGRYLVLVPDSDDRSGISRRLSDEERRRLRTIINETRPPGYGVIVRTAAEGATKDDIAADIERLTKTWEQIKNKASGGKAPRLIHKEPDLVIRVIREHFTSDFRRLIVNDKETRNQIIEYLESTSPELVSKVQGHDGDIPVFERFHVEDQLRKALDRNVWLPSGGHIVIERTEALTVIDVNTGRFVGRSNLEETVLQNNLEAAAEIARQLRLRDIGGIIVIDFIDMESAKNRRAVLQKLQEELAKDKSRTQVSEVSAFGLVEMTRKHVSEGLVETFSEVCPTCKGRGLLLHEGAATTGAPIPESNGESKDES